VDKNQALRTAGGIAAIVCILVLAIPTLSWEKAPLQGDAFGGWIDPTVECGSVISRDSDSSRCDGPINQRKVIAVIVGGVAAVLLRLSASSDRTSKKSNISNHLGDRSLKIGTDLTSRVVPFEELEVFCSNCEAKVSESAKFCPSCGFSFEEEPVPCPNPECEAIPTEGAAFCDQCGTVLKTEV